jgi:hypothetical protein
VGLDWTTQGVAGAAVAFAGAISGIFGAALALASGVYSRRYARVTFTHSSIHPFTPSPI